MNDFSDCAGLTQFELMAPSIEVISLCALNVAEIRQNSELAIGILTNSATSNGLEIYETAI